MLARRHTRCAVAVFAALAALCGGQRARAEGESCVPAAHLRAGDEVAVELQQQLRLLGVSDVATEGCPQVDAEVLGVPDGYSVELDDGEGHRESRVVSDLGVAATWIDSWLHQDLVSPLLAVRVAAAPTPSAPLATTPASTPVAVARAAQPTTRSHPLHLGAAYETGASSDDRDWSFFRGDACVGLGPLCVGVLARFGSGKVNGIPVDELAGVNESRLDLVAQVRGMIRVGHTTVEPHLALGSSRESMSQTVQPGCPPGPACTDSAMATVTGETSSWRPLVEAGLSLGVPVAERVSLVLGGAIDARLYGRSTELVQEQPVDLPDPPPGICPTPDGMDCVAPDSIPLFYPSEAARQWRLSLGLRIDL